MMGHFLGSDVGPGKESGEGFSLGCSREEIALKWVFTGHHPFAVGCNPEQIRQLDNHLTHSIF
jgi:hypothetical protein